MSDTETKTELSQFLPNSQRDFDAYAKNLAWLIGESVPTSRDLLARIYGFANEQEVAAALTKRQKSGPTDDDVSQGESVDGLVRGMQEEGRRRSRALQLLARHKGEAITALARRLRKIADLSLFESPESHRAAYAKLRAMYDILEDRSHAAQRSVGDYAYIETSKGGYRGSDEAIIVFTPLGRSVYSALEELLPDEFALANGRVELRDAMEQVEGLIERHPENPWLRAGYVCTFGRHYFQCGWDQDLRVRRRTAADDRGGYEQLDADPGFKKYARKNSELFLGHAKRAIDLFTELFGDLAERAPPHNLAGTDGDNFYYPAILYFGAVVAQNAGDEKLALAWAKRNRKLVEGDNFGARYLLASLMLNKGASDAQIGRLFSKESNESVGWLARSAAAAAEGRVEASIDAFVECASDTWAILDVFSHKWTKAREKLMIHSNHDTPAFFQEFLARSSGFWTQHENVRQKFEVACGDKTVREIVLAHHERSQLSWGLGLKSQEERARVLALQAERPATFRADLKERLSTIWS